MAAGGFGNFSKGAKVAGVVIGHPERMVYPGDQFSKMEVARYYERVGDLMLPFVANRPLAIIRAPGGITGEMFFQKSFTTHLPAFVHQRDLGDGTIFYVQDTAGLDSRAPRSKSTRGNRRYPTSRNRTSSRGI